MRPTAWLPEAAAAPVPASPPAAIFTDAASAALPAASRFLIAATMGAKSGANALAPAIRARMASTGSTATRRAPSDSQWGRSSRVKMPDAPGIGFERKADLWAVMKDIA